MWTGVFRTSSDHCSSTQSSIAKDSACGGDLPGEPHARQSFSRFANAEIANVGKNSQGQTIPLASIGLADGYDLDHRHSAFMNMYHDGKMDGDDKNSVSCIGMADCPSNSGMWTVRGGTLLPVGYSVHVR